MERILVTLEVRDEYLYRAARHRFVDRANCLRIDASTAVRQLVPIDAGDHHVLERHACDGLCYATRLVHIEFVRHSVGDTAVFTGSRADVAENHESGRAGLPALADVRTTRLFTNGVEALRSHLFL